jgi:4-diphosphocytidyl-2-C-methyl-D-erythritol kinase
MVTEQAYAKINLALHVTGQRKDGYHLLDSLVAFAGIGDVVRVERADFLRLEITGPQAAYLPVSPDNLVLRAARAMAARAAITLDKHLPVASGIGGGSADAAATLRALARLTGRPLPQQDDLLALGADVPVCMGQHPVRMQGVGEVITPAPALPKCSILLANPGLALHTPAVFKALTQKENPALPPIPAFTDLQQFTTWLTDQRNDLEAPARTIAPEIEQVKAAIAAQSGCLLARMSGSGATCFGLFATTAGADRARAKIAAEHPEWWLATGPLLS